MSRAKVLARFVIEPARAGLRAAREPNQANGRLVAGSPAQPNPLKIYPVPRRVPLNPRFPISTTTQLLPSWPRPARRPSLLAPSLFTPRPSLATRVPPPACIRPLPQSSTPLARQTLAAGCAAASRKQPGGRPCASCGRVAPRPLPRSACACSPVASWRKTFFEVFTPVSHTLFDLADIINKVLVLEAWNALSRRSMPVKCLEFNSYLIFLLPNYRTVVSGSRPPVLPLPKNELVAASIFSSRLTS